MVQDFDSVDHSLECNLTWIPGYDVNDCHCYATDDREHGDQCVVVTNQLIEERYQQDGCNGEPSAVLCILLEKKTHLLLKGGDKKI